MIVFAWRRTGLGALLEHTGPGAAQPCPGVMRSKGILERADDNNLNHIRALLNQIGNIALPRFISDIARRFTVNYYFRDAPVPLAQLDNISAVGLRNIESLFITDARGIKRAALLFPGLPVLCRGRQL